VRSVRACRMRSRDAVVMSDKKAIVTQAGFAELWRTRTGEWKAFLCEHCYRTCELVRAFYTTEAGPENTLADTKLNCAAAHSRLRTASPTDRETPGGEDQF
jgi:hypothetical protein